mmetsp:Transcript_4745/g.8618  ORF Transcript_4745/g.8618 Transcript_4745/m.8618 type:complete len:1349 (+) Transcript_4745:123-4169(+)|eukprot:CAMPEP_0197525240 /NCGR_PEP_ID=MMETSP1318-20131121/10702_1 /TAXON_ID=552666 /ORGANISM="Partenskyella glossopodia, Strain RCC365" /LENGTH=1348 /DNA_ID=CAMNT_0043078435 /DNA_START=46 /DNA_END=4092 /DNA_ORIENTATION=+
MDYENYELYPGYSAPKLTGHTAFTTAQWTGITVMGILKNLYNAIRGIPDWRTNDPEGDENGLPKLFRTKQGLYIRLLYALVEDTFNRPIASEPGDYIDCLIREHDKTYKGFYPPLRLTDRTKRCLNLSSYNYLGFGGVDKYPKATEILRNAILDMPISTASPSAELGHLPIHRQLEQQLAKFLGKEDCMLVGMGFATNSTVIPSLVGKGDLIVSDQLNHTSIVQGARESGAKIKPFVHNDPADLERVLQEAVLGPKKYGKILLIIEGIYSMEGDLCKLKEIIPVAKRYGAYVYLDEAHSIGAVGPTGRGVTEEAGIGTDDINIMMGTFSKSFGSSGGYIAGDRDVVNHVRQYAAGATDAASMPPACAMQIIQALKMIEGKDGTDIGPKKLQAIRENSCFFRKSLEDMGFEVLGDAPSPVIPVMLYTPTKIGDFSRMAFKRGLAVVTVGAPAVPLMYGRVRFCISAAHERKDLENALQIISELGDELQLKYRGKHAPNPRAPGTLDSLEHKRLAEAEARAAKVAAKREEALKARKKIKWNPLVDKKSGDVNPYGWADRDVSLMAKSKIVLSNWDYLGLASDPTIQAACIQTLEKKGLGSCGPRGFYGTYPEHLRAERDLAAFLETDQAVLYPFGACTVSSVIACMATRDDILIVDEGVGRNVLTGVSLTRAKVHFYKHCDMEDCERVLKEVSSHEWKALSGVMGPSPKRKFLISEAIFGSSGDLAPVDKLAELRLKYKCRFILDETHSFGTLGATGRGATEHFGIGSSAVDVLCASLEGSGASCCGFSAGPTGVVSYQRLLGSGYCYSAAPPPYLATSVSAAISSLRKTGDARLRKLRANAQRLRSGVASIPGLRVMGALESPMVLVSVEGEKDPAILDKICHNAQRRGVAISRANNIPKMGLKPSADLPVAIRLCASSSHDNEGIDYAISVLREEVKSVVGKIERKVSSKAKAAKKPKSSKQAKKSNLVPTTPISPQTHGDDKPVSKASQQEASSVSAGVSMPLLMVVWFVLSLYRQFLNRESVVTGRFVTGWLHKLRLDRNSTSPAVRAFYHLARCFGSHRTYGVMLPVIYWSFGCSVQSALPFITYCLVCIAGCFLKCAMSEGAHARRPSRSWPSISAMNAVTLPFFLLRHYLGEKWLYNSFGLQSLLIVSLAVVWVFAISLGRMEIGDSPSNIVGGLVSGAIATHVMRLMMADSTLGFLEGSVGFFACPAILFAMAALLLCPLPISGRDFAMKFYGHAARHMVTMVTFMVGVSMFPQQAVVATWYATGLRAAWAFVMYMAFSVVCTLLIRKFLATVITGVCANVPSLRRHGLSTYTTMEPILNAFAKGVAMSTAVPAAVNFLVAA